MQERTARVPDLAVEQQAVRAGSTPDHWFVTWRVTNLGEDPISIHTSRLPHGRFRGLATNHRPAVKLPPAASVTIELPVTCDRLGGPEVENAFLILSVQLRRKRWLILARLRVTLAPDGPPYAKAELISAQPVGFADRMEEDKSFPS